MKIYNRQELSNEDYQALPQISGSSLVRIYNDCPAMFKFGKPKESPALADGIAAHACILEPDVFDAQFVRDLDPAEYPNALHTAKDMQAWLKGRGIKGHSGKVKAELIEFIVGIAGEKPMIFDVEQCIYGLDNEGKTLVKPATYDMIQQMRRVIFADDDYASAMTGAEVEVSLVDESSGLKCRIDCITATGEIWDYKTTTSAHPDAFAKQAHDSGYWMKMALQHDLYHAAYGESPGRVVLLAQSKTEPYIPQAYELTPQQLNVGREQYEAAFRLYERCRALDSWPAYGGGVQELPTPQWLAKKYDF